MDTQQHLTVEHQLRMKAVELANSLFFSQKEDDKPDNTELIERAEAIFGFLNSRSVAEQPKAVRSA